MLRPAAGADAGDATATSAVKTPGIGGLAVRERVATRIAEGSVKGCIASVALSFRIGSQEALYRIERFVGIFGWTISHTGRPLLMPVATFHGPMPSADWSASIMLEAIRVALVSSSLDFSVRSATGNRVRSPEITSPKSPRAIRISKRLKA